MQNQIPNNWQKVKIGDIANVTKLAGFEFTKYIKYSKDGEIIALRALNLTDGGFDLSNVQRIDKSISDNLKRSKLYRGDILLSYTGTIGNFAIVGENGKFHLAPNVSRIRVNEKYSSKFLYHFFRTKEFKHSLIGYSHGSSQSTIPMKNIREIPVPFPPLGKQNMIASLLSLFDDKIELNNKIAKTLKEMAQTIFKEWFVKFKFPGYTKVKFVDSELGKIPEGWRVGLVKDFGRVITGKTPSTRDSSNFGSDYPFITIPDMDNTFIVETERFLSKKGTEKMSSMLLPQNAICVSCIATVGLVGITTKESLTNQQINSLVPTKDFYIYYLYKIFKSMKKDLELRGSGGTATLIINKSKFENIELVIPDNDILLQFDKLVRPMYGKVLKITEENQKLAALRDLLLPKLMKGEIRV